MRSGIALVATAVALLTGAPAAAQQDTVRQGTPQERAQLEERVRRNMARVLQARLGLTDEQMRRLTGTSVKYMVQRRTLMDQERDARMALRDELLADQADDRRVSDLIDRLIRVQQQRLDIVVAEQRELATFLTPVQRAKYLALQDQMRRRMDEIRGQRPPGRHGTPRRRGPPGGM